MPVKRSGAAVFNLVLVYNPGAAFSSQHRRRMAARTFRLYRIGSLRSHPVCFDGTHDYLFCFALSLILGGAIGNATDRVLLGAVVDFLDVHAAGIIGLHSIWPTARLPVALHC